LRLPMITAKDTHTCFNQATAASWAWINANGKEPKIYQELNMLAMKVWDHMLPRMVHWCGTLVVTHKAKQAVSEYTALEVSLDEAKALESALDFTPSARVNVGWDTHKVFHFPQEGLVEPGEAIKVSP
jgi:hypothetical protein